MIVMSITEMWETTETGISHAFVTAAVSISAKFVAAEADVKKPARVTPIWMVERNLLEFFVSFTTCFAFL